MNYQTITTHMQAAFIYTNLSTSPDKAACLIIKENQVISTGYNKTSSVIGEDSESHMIHAETDAVSIRPDACVGATAFVTRNPSLVGAKSLVEAGVSAVYYIDNSVGFKCLTERTSGISYLKECGVPTFFVLI